MNKIIFQLLLYCCISGISVGQVKMLRLEDAISLGLKNNYSILIAGNETKISENNNTAGNAGFLPQINVSGGYKENIFSTTSTDFNQVSTSTNNQSGVVNLGASLDWTLFNGFGMFLKKEKLETLQSQQQTSLRSTVENTIADIIVSYYSIVQLKNSLEVLQNAITFSNNRYELTRKKFQIGTSSELSFLNASTDLNADSASFLRQKVAFANAKSRLNTLLVLDPESDFDCATEIRFENLPEYAQLKQTLSTNNSQINLAQKNVDLLMIEYRLSHSPKYPQVNFFSDYSFIRSNYSSGANKIIQNTGPVLGVTLAMPVFDGFNKKRISANAKIDVESGKLAQEKIIRSMNAELWQLYNEYRNNMKLVTLETSNLEVARLNSKISFEKFRVGQMSDFELRQVQLSELEAENSLLTAQFQAKTSEIELLRLSGKLIESRKQ